LNLRLTIMSEGTSHSHHMIEYVSNFTAGEKPVYQNTPILPADIVGDGSVKLFNKWSFEDVEVKDISLTYAIREIFPYLMTQ
jgi:hypothetical protein